MNKKVFRQDPHSHVWNLVRIQNNFLGRMLIDSVYSNYCKSNGALPTNNFKVTAPLYCTLLWLS